MEGFSIILRVCYLGVEAGAVGWLEAGVRIRICLVCVYLSLLYFILTKILKGVSIVFQQVKQLPSGATESERSDVLFDVRRILALREDQAVAEPNDGENNGQIVSLKQVELRPTMT